MNLACPAKMWKGELHSGRLNVNAVFSTNSAQAKHFRTNIRAYNSGMAFASLGIQENVLPSHGPYSLSIHGNVYHRIGLPTR